MSEPNRGLPVAHFFGWLFVAVGVMWIAFSGVCTVSVLTSTDGPDAGLIVLALAFGGVSVSIGWGILSLGRALVARPPAPPAS